MGTEPALRSEGGNSGSAYADPDLRESGLSEMTAWAPTLSLEHSVGDNIAHGLLYDKRGLREIWGSWIMLE